LLRLSHSFNQFNYHLPMTDAWQTRSAMDAMLDISAILARADIKSELIKEMERQTMLLGKMRQSQGVDTHRLENILQQLSTSATELHSVGGQLGKQIRDNEFLKSIQQRSSIPGGNCDFDLPLYHYWLELPHETRSAQMQEWISCIEPLRNAVDLLLMLVRGSNIPRNEIAEKGFFQKTLDGNITVQLVRIIVDKSLALYPEVSGSKHRFNIRFMETEPLDHPPQTSDNVDFILTTCVI
jgi:cell division protein ZapD